MNSQLILTTWPDKPKIVDEGNPDIATVAQQYEKVFIYGKNRSSHCDKANEAIILKRFGKSQIYKKNLMANNHMEAVDLNKVNRGGKPTLNDQRVKAIQKCDVEFARFFLQNLHDMTWKDYENGVLTTIPFNEAFEMLQVSTETYYDLKIAFVKDVYSKDLSFSEMQNVIKLHNLNNEYTLGKDLKKNN